MGVKAALSARAFFLLVLTLSALGAVHGRDVAIKIGAQPPLLSPSGGIVDLVVTAALRARGHRVTLEWLPIGRMLSELQSDALDVYVTPSNTPEQQNPHVHVLEARGVFFYKKARTAAPAKRLEDLAGKRVATVVNSPLRPMLEKVGAIVDEGPFETMFDKLDLGRVDYTATADVGGILTIRAAYPGREREFSFTDFSYSNISAGLYVKNRPDLLPILDELRAGLAALKADGTLQRMLIDFFGPEHWRLVRVVE
jgi:ABC-type amino acid transport substrate-binding protein